MMANIELLEVWVSSGKTNLVSGKANQVTQVFQTCSSYPKLSGSNQIYESGEAGVRLGKTDSASGKANGVIRDALGLPGLA
jgi:hypothetical protein